MSSPRLKLPLSLFTDHEANVNSSTVSTEIVCQCAQITAKVFANLNKWRDGPGDLLAWAWESLDKLRARGVPARAWSRALSFDFIDMLRDRTNWRNGRGEMEARTHNFAQIEDQRYGRSSSFGDNGINLLYEIEARRDAPDSLRAILADFESELREIPDPRARRVVELIAEGYTLFDAGERLKISESRASQLLAQVCAQFHGQYLRWEITRHEVTPARRAHLNKLKEANRKRAHEQPETFSENSDATG